MKQPDLGRKISELRLAKGLTQGELAEICKLSLRTIQRIESAEVTPRSYTIKLIFESLDYEIYNSFGKFSYKLDRTAYRTKSRLEQINNSLLNLFNLKTNTIRKLSILSIPFFAISAFFLFSYSSNAKAQNRQTIINKYEEASSNSTFIRLFNSGEIDSLGLLHHNNACLMPDYPSIITGRDNIIDYYRQLFNQGFQFSEILTTFTIVNDSLAVERALWVLKANPTTVLKGSSLTQWRFSEGQWWIENSMSKTDGINQELFK
jgi:transcriptional regulator with XRE-family HTH domain